MAPHLPLFAPLFVFRLANALLARSFFQPDEFYQALEQAHRFVFGYGYLPWEWRPLSASTGGLRSPLHPLLFVPGYWLLRALALDDNHRLLLLAPKVTQAAIAAVSDLATYVLASKLLAPAYAPAALACSLASFFNAYAGVRTLSNSAETALTACALALWPWTGDRVARSWSGLILSISFISLAVIIRPSSILLWVLLSSMLLLNSRAGSRIDVVALFAVMGIASAFICFVMDSSFYGRPTFTPLNFVNQNLFHGISSHYGVNRWHFYFVQAFPFVNFSIFPTVILGMLFLSSQGSNLESHHQLLRLRSARLVTLGVMIGLSLLSHKEFRFIQPLVPLFNCFAARAMVNNYTKSDIDTAPTGRPGALTRLGRLVRSRPIGLVIRSAISLGAAFYFNWYHYRAQVSVMNHLRQIPNEELRSLGFLMPCHSTPWQSHLHKPHLAQNGSQERMWMLTCEPPILRPLATNVTAESPVTGRGVQADKSTAPERAKRSTAQPDQLHSTSPAADLSRSDERAASQVEPYRDESDEFYINPVEFIRNRFPEKVNPNFLPMIVDSVEVSQSSRRMFEWPSHLVIFESLWKESSVRELLIEKGYEVVWQEWNSRRHEDPRRTGDVMVLKWRPGPPSTAAK